LQACVVLKKRDAVSKNRGDFSLNSRIS